MRTKRQSTKSWQLPDGGGAAILSCSSCHTLQLPLWPDPPSCRCLCPTPQARPAAPHQLVHEPPQRCRRCGGQPARPRLATALRTFVPGRPCRWSRRTRCACSACCAGSRAGRSGACPCARPACACVCAGHGQQQPYPSGAAGQPWPSPLGATWRAWRAVTPAVRGAAPPRWRVPRHSMPNPLTVYTSPNYLHTGILSSSITSLAAAVLLPEQPMRCCALGPSIVP